MKKYLVFIGTFLLSIIGVYIFFIGILKLLDDAMPGFINNPPTVIGMFIIFLAFPSLIAYYVAFEFKKSKKMVGLELGLGHDMEVEKPQSHRKESHWLFALIVTFVIGGVITGLLAIFPPIQWEPYSFVGVDESEFQTDENVYTEASQNANWKTYSDAEFKFQIKYPASWYVGKQSGAIYISDNPIPDIPLTHGLPSAFQMAVDLISNSEDFNPSWKTQESVIRVDEVQGKKFVDLEPSPALEVLETRIIVDNLLYRYTFVFRNQDNQGNYNPIFDQILSTFKFN